MVFAARPRSVYTAVSLSMRYFSTYSWIFWYPVLQVLRTSGQELKAAHSRSLRPHTLVLQVLRTSVIGEGGGKCAAEAA